MIDSLFARAHDAIEENRKLQQQSRTLRARCDEHREDIRRTICECASIRTEINACRQELRLPPLEQLEKARPQHIGGKC